VAAERARRARHALSLTDYDWIGRPVAAENERYALQALSTAKITAMAIERRRM